MPKQKVKKAKPVSKKAMTGVPHLEKSVLSRKNADGTIAIMRLENDEFFFTLDGIAAEIWGLIDGKRSFDKIESQ
ncbi:MAG: hypothetical protein ACXWPM_06895, partial [Bdellovibrionota bacterium]